MYANSFTVWDVQVVFKAHEVPLESHYREFFEDYNLKRTWETEGYTVCDFEMKIAVESQTLPVLS